MIHASANEPTYKIHGVARRVEKKRLAELKSLAKNWNYCRSLEKDMYQIYGGSDDYEPMSDELAEKRLNNIEIEIKEIEHRLSVLNKQNTN